MGTNPSTMTKWSSYKPKMCESWQVKKAKHYLKETLVDLEEWSEGAHQSSNRSKRNHKKIEVEKKQGRKYPV